MISSYWMSWPWNRTKWSKVGGAVTRVRRPDQDNLRVSYVCLCSSLRRSPSPSVETKLTQPKPGFGSETFNRKIIQRKADKDSIPDLIYKVSFRAFFVHFFPHSKKLSFFVTTKTGINLHEVCCQKQDIYLKSWEIFQVFVCVVCLSWNSCRNHTWMTKRGRRKKVNQSLTHFLSTFSSLNNSFFLFL